jgi:hypothetical protein
MALLLLKPLAARTIERAEMKRAELEKLASEQPVRRAA